MKKYAVKSIFMGAVIITTTVASYGTDNQEPFNCPDLSPLIVLQHADSFPLRGNGNSIILEGQAWRIFGVDFYPREENGSFVANTQKPGVVVVADQFVANAGENACRYQYHVDSNNVASIILVHDSEAHAGHLKPAKNN